MSEHPAFELVREQQIGEISSLARGVPVGGELDWLDDGTIIQALRQRRPA